MVPSKNFTAHVTNAWNASTIFVTAVCIVSIAEVVRLQTNFTPASYTI